jgi:hypothetical protein
MGSGTNRKFWREKGSRAGRRSGTKSFGMRRKGDTRWQKMKGWRAEAKRRASDGRPRD